MSLTCTRDYTLLVNPPDDPGPVLGFPTAMEYYPGTGAGTDRIFMSGYRLVTGKYDHGVSIINPATGVITKKIITLQDVALATHRIYSINYSSLTNRLYLDNTTGIVVLNPVTLAVEATWVNASHGLFPLENAISTGGFLLKGSVGGSAMTLIDITTGIQNPFSLLATTGRSTWLPTRNAFWYVGSGEWDEIDETGALLNQFQVSGSFQFSRWACYDPANNNIYGTAGATFAGIVGWNLTPPNPDPFTFDGYLDILDMSGDIAPPVQFGRPVFCPTNSLTYLPATALNKLVVVDGSAYAFSSIVTAGETAFNLPIYGVFCTSDGKLYFSKNISTPGFTRVVP